MTDHRLSTLDEYFGDKTLNRELAQFALIQAHGNSQIAEEVFHNVYIRCRCRESDARVPIEHLEHYLHACIRNEVADQDSKRKREEKLVEELNEKARAALEIQLAARHQAREILASPDDRSLLDKLGAMLDASDARSRKIVYLKVFRKHSHSDIAAELEITVVNSRQIFSQNMRKIKRAFASSANARP